MYTSENSVPIMCLTLRHSAITCVNVCIVTTYIIYQKQHWLYVLTYVIRKSLISSEAKKVL